MVVDFRRTKRDHKRLNIDGSSLKIVKNNGFFGDHLTEDLTWCLNTCLTVKKAQQCLYFLQRLKKVTLQPPILTAFCREAIKSILSSCITTSFGNCIIAV